jgi:hypothetical protein
MPVMVSTLTPPPVTRTLESVALRHLSTMFWPLAAGGRFTVEVM